MYTLLILQGCTLIALCISVAWLLNRLSGLSQLVENLQQQVSKAEVALFESCERISDTQSDLQNALKQSGQRTLYSSSDRNHKRAIDSIKNGMEAESLCRYYGLNEDEVSLLTMMHQRPATVMPVVESEL